MANILVIDDSRDMLTMLRMILERRAEHTVHECQSGPEGLNTAFQIQPDIAVIDIMMPGMDGYTVVRRLRADPRTKSMGIIVLTARGQPVDQQAALAAGADAHMSKPVDVPHLLATIDDLLPGSRKSSAAMQNAPRSSAAGRSMPNKFVLPVFSLKGGVGTTTLATNLAILMQQVGQSILWDLSSNSGHCALMCGMQPQKHWGQLVQNPKLAITDIMLQHRSGVRLLAAPPIPVVQQRLSAKQAGDTLAALQAAGTFIIIDMPSTLDDMSVSMLEQAHRVILVTGDTPAAIQSTIATLHRIKEIHSRIMVVRNTVHHQAGPSVEVLQRALKLKLQGDIGYENAQVGAERKGIPLAVSEPNAPLIMTLKRLAQMILTP